MGRLVHSYCKELLSTYYVSGGVADIRRTVVNSTGNVFSLLELRERSLKSLNVTTGRDLGNDES